MSNRNNCVPPETLNGLYEHIKTGTWREVHPQYKHELGRTPILHAISSIRFKSVDFVQLDSFVKFWVENGYNINRQTDKYIAQKRASLGFTALLAAVEKSNIVLVEVLIKNGADVNIRDSSGFSACHWAVLVGDMSCLLKLIDLGADLRSSYREQKGEDVHPLLHTAVDEGRTEMVFYLLDKGLVDANEEATYKNVLSEKSFTHFPSRYKCTGMGDRFSSETHQSLEIVDLPFTPLARAVRMRKIPIIEVLLKHNATLSEYSELHFCIVEGDTEVACLLKGNFSDEGLRNDKIDQNWALHCLHSIAFQDELRIEKTKELICDYVDAGWDINSLSCNNTRKIIVETSFIISSIKMITLSGCSLLHLACMFQSQSIIECLVEEGADVNVIMANSDGCAQLYPLQISLLVNDWKSCIFLIENGANTQAVGYLDTELKQCAQEDTAANAMELLLKRGHEGSVLVLDAMLQKGFHWNGAKELHFSIEGGNPTLIKKVLESVAQNITVDDLSWVRINIYGTVEIVPSLVLLMIVCDTMSQLDFNGLAALMTLFALHGYDFNARIKKTEASCVELREDPLIFLILGIDFKHGSNILKTVMEIEHVQLNVRNSEGLTPVDWVLRKWSERCSNGDYCWKTKDAASYCSQTVKMLVNYGVDVSELTIESNFKYHFGYNEMIQVLYCAGAKIHLSFFEQPVCNPGYVAARSFHAEVEALKKWVEEKNNRLQINLQFLSRLKIRKMLSSIGSINALNDLPGPLKYQILCSDVLI